MKRVGGAFVVICVLIIALAVALVLIPLYLILSPFSASKEDEQKRFDQYMFILEGKNFFCYNNRTEAISFVEEQILPRLHGQIENIYLDGRIPQSNYEREAISLLLYNLKNYAGFPHLVKIRGGQVVDYSINNQFFNVMRQRQSLEVLIDDIHEFFGLQDLEG